MQEREHSAEMLLVPPNRWIPRIFRDLCKLWILHESKNCARVAGYFVAAKSPPPVSMAFWNLTWF
jgi:hypothetical protein